MPLDVRFKTFAGNGLDDRCGNHVGFSELRTDECIHMTEARPMRRCVARPRKGCQQNERATYTTMDGRNLSHSCRPTARLPNASDPLDDVVKQPASALAHWVAVWPHFGH
jgi:hypothetical protein